MPQFPGKLTNARIWVDQVMIDHFSDLAYVRLMRTTTKEETLSGKSPFERWADTLGVKINRYHEDNGILYEQPFRSAIEDSNQTITFFRVGCHHQNAMTGRKY